jgi:ABC-2 type transport system permease protein
LEDEVNSYSSGANVNLAMNAISSMVGEREALAIRSKSLDYSYLTIPESTASTLKLVLIGVFPLAYLGIGIAVFVSRRRKQNVTV